MTNATSPVALLALLVASWLSLAGCEPASGSPSAADVPGGVGVPPAAGDPTGEYVVRGVRDDVVGDLRLLVNGFPVWKGYGFAARSRPGAGLAAPATAALVSGRNEAAVEVVPFLQPTADSVAVGAVRLRLWVEAPDGAVIEGTEVSSDSAFAAWERALGERWPGWSGGGPAAALDSAWAWAQAHPVRVETAWVRPGGAAPSDGGPSFDAVFREAPVLGGTAADSARLRDYAVHLRDLVAAGDGAALYDEFAPALRDNATLSGRPPVPPDSARARWAQRSASDGTGVVDSDPAPLAPSGVGLRSWSGGRVWELYRPGADGLLQGRDGGTYVEVFVGEVDGRLRVVRQ